MSRFLSENYAELKPYTPGEQPQDMQYIKLNTNESPFAPSPKVIEAINKQETQKLRLYSDPQLKLLIKEIAAFYGISESMVTVGNGSDEILAFSFLAFFSGSKGVCFADITYGFYKVYAKLFGAKAVQIPLKEDFSVDIYDYAQRSENVVIANPNAPTGIALTRRELEKLLVSNPNRLVLIDEAYVDFGAESCVPLCKKYDNLLVVQTFSKSRNLAGARIGFAIASEKIIEDINKIKFSFNPYNVNRLSTVAGANSMADRDYFEKCTQQIIKTREKTKSELCRRGFTVLNSSANFLFAKCGKISGEEFYNRLKEKGVLVRHFNEERINKFVRITIGSEEEMDILIQKTDEILKGE